MSLSVLALLLAAVFLATGIFMLLRADQFSKVAQTLPRNIPVGYVLMGIATAWFVYNVGQENIADLEKFQKPMMIGFATVGILTCIYVSDYLPVRGIGILLMLIAKFMLDIARWHDSDWRKVVSLLAYVWVFFGMWFTISPYRMRDVLDWMIAGRKRLQIFAGTKIALGALMLLLALTAFRG